ncbi:hypothetical protein [Methylobacillus sp.]|uniref:phage tail fiber protein n=1 Tax=Methylobacillus sp. TaxID=56818 RepID=UPI0012CECB6A|nr:hypothetical protein [Methylobacillus sp.]MPS48557.1 hypothetical protein [Methylobacillus sp.]
MPLFLNEHLERPILDFIFRGNLLNLQPPTALYFGLLDVNGVEITGTPGFPRVEQPCSYMNWRDFKGGTEAISYTAPGTDRGYIVNLNSIRFPKPTFDFVAYGIAVYDAPTGGNMWFAESTPPYEGLTWHLFGPQLYGDEGFMIYLNTGDQYSGPMSSYLTMMLGDFLFRGNAGNLQPPTNLYLGLMTAPAGGNISTATEVNGQYNGYVRQQIPCTTESWKEISYFSQAQPEPVYGLENDIEIFFPEVTGNYGNVVAYGLWDAPTGGRLIWAAPLNNQVRVEYGDERPRVPRGNIQIFFDVNLAHVGST